MTKEEAIRCLTSLAELRRKYGGMQTFQDEAQCLEMAIKALEQESILDKIRAEIVDLGQRTMNDNRASGIWACRDIIDKYKVESEEV